MFRTIIEVHHYSKQEGGHMQFESVMQLKGEVVEKELGIQAFTDMSGGVSIQAVDSIPRPESRLAVGFSLVKPKEYQLELRVQRRRGSAYKRAQEWKKKARGEARILVVDEISVPPLTQIQSKTGDSYFRARRRPLKVGLSISSDSAGTGTLGAFVEHKESGDTFILTNNHVLANYDPRVQRKKPIYQPGRAEATLRLDNRIGELRDSIVVLRDQVNFLDAAVAVLDKQDDHDGNVIPADCGCPLAGKRIQGVAGFEAIQKAFSDEHPVMKVGRTSGYTEGIISAMSVDGVPVRHPTEGLFLFNNVYEVKAVNGHAAFSTAGDSGSTVLMNYQRELVAVGLHFAGGPAAEGRRKVHLSYFCSLQLALKELELDWME
jgi:hypothetical protein